MVKRRRLNKALVIATAAELANELGTVEDLSLKALAAKLDIRVPSLYNHVDGIDGLLRDLTLFAAEQILTRMQRAGFGKTGREAIVSLSAEVRQFAYENPAIYPLTIRAPHPEESELIALSHELVQVPLVLLASLGLEGDDAAHALRGLRAIIYGFVAIDLASGYMMDLDKDESFSRLLNGYLDGITAK